MYSLPIFAVLMSRPFGLHHDAVVYVLRCKELCMYNIFILVLYSNVLGTKLPVLSMCCSVLVCTVSLSAFLYAGVTVHASVCNMY